MFLNDMQPFTSDLPLRAPLRTRVVGIVSREAAASASTHPSEVVGCRLDDGSLRWLHVKREAAERSSSFGHRGGLSRELAVYREVLDPQRDGTPELLGWEEGRTSVLVLEHLDDAVPVHHAEGGLIRAASWLARFHATSPGSTWLPHLGRAYYLRWLHRTVEQQSLAGTSPSLLRALERLRRDPGPYVGPLVSGRSCVVHGEFFPANVLWTAGAVRPVDWESAAVGVGEVDVASLVDDWPFDVAEEAVAEYVRRRWPDDLTQRRESRRRLSAAAAYWSFRWLGDGRPWTDRTRASALDVLEARLEDLRR